MILSDTFAQFAEPMMEKLGRPTILCHTLEVDDESRRVTGWTIRMEDQKTPHRRGSQRTQLQCHFSGDSYNDTSMLAASNAGFLINPPSNVVEEFPQYPVVTDFEQLLSHIEAAASAIGE